MRRSEDLRLLLVTDGSGEVERILAVARAARAGGLRTIQVREPRLGGRDLWGLVRSLREVFPPGDGTVLVNDRIDVALSAETDGVHLGYRSVAPADARRLLPRGAIGVSVHDVEEARRAAGAAADYLVFGPVYPTPSKAGRLEARGPGTLAEAAKGVSVPLLAIGGIDPDRAVECARAGAFGVACIRAIFEADDPEHAARSMLAGVREGLAR